MVLSYDMRALTVDKQLYAFNIRDAPTRISDGKYCITRKPGSPLLYLDVVMRGTDTGDLWEGDIIKDNDGTLYLIYYYGGFFARSVGKTKYLSELGDYEKVGNCFDTDFPFSPTFAGNCLFKYRGKFFHFYDIIGAVKDKFYAHGIVGKINPDEVQQPVGTDYNGVDLYYGDLVDGLPVFMKMGRPVINTPDGLVDVGYKWRD